MVLKHVYLLSVLALFASCTNDHQKVVNKSSYTIKVGESFQLELSQNASTGYTNCWINKSDCTSVRKTSSKWIPSEREKEGCVGCSSPVRWTFTGIKPGRDTLEIYNCPALWEGRDCDFYNSDTMDITQLQLVKKIPVHVIK
ncbi:MAG: protease inhibitor I42 family protein [Fluviicola sp.]